jgi:hypothetical protein
MVKYIIFAHPAQADMFIYNINRCMGYPNDTGTETYAYVDVMCAQDEETQEWQEIGWGVEIKDFILDCIDEMQKGYIITLDETICACASLQEQNILSEQ